jgi:CheY-like chemotaxis protein
MSDRDTINAHIPLLRRHARMLIGYREAADRVILALLSRPIPGAAEAKTPREAQLALHRAFARCLAATNWETFATAPRGAEAGEPGAIPGLQALSLIRRQVILLADVEKLSFSDIAHILEVSLESVQWHYDEAHAALTAARPARVMIIEDDTVIAMDLSFMVEEAGHDVVAVASREGEAIERGIEAKPDVILSDVQLKEGGSGLEAVRRITSQVDVPVIFITAFPEKLMTGEPFEPTFVITKPYDPATVRTALLQTLSLKRDAGNSAAVAA